MEEAAAAPPRKRRRLAALEAELLLRERTLVEREAVCLREAAVAERERWVLQLQRQTEATGRRRRGCTPSINSSSRGVCASGLLHTLACSLSRTAREGTRYTRLEETRFRPWTTFPHGGAAWSNGRRFVDFPLPMGGVGVPAHAAQSPPPPVVDIDAFRVVYKENLFACACPFRQVRACWRRSRGSR